RRRAARLVDAHRRTALHEKVAVDGQGTDDSGIACADQGGRRDYRSSLDDADTSQYAVGNESGARVEVGRVKINGSHASLDETAAKAIAIKQWIIDIQSEPVVIEHETIAHDHAEDILNVGRVVGRGLQDAAIEKEGALRRWQSTEAIFADSRRLD